MPIERSDVEHVARLARLDLSDAEMQTFQKQLDKILEHAGRVVSLDTEGVPPTSHPTPMSNVFRPDVVEQGLSAEEALSNAPAAEAGHFRVPRILESGA